MLRQCATKTSGGKGNIGSFIERDRNVCAAGVPTLQADQHVPELLEKYSLQDEVDSLISDAIIPPPKPKHLPPLRHPIPLDRRNAGPFCDVKDLVNPPQKTKFQTLVDEIKSSSYKSFWTKPVGKGADPRPLLPAGFDLKGTTFGRKLVRPITLYDLVMPKNPMPEKVVESKLPGQQTRHNYCTPPYNPDMTFGHKTALDPRGILMKCALTDDDVKLGKQRYTPMSFIKADWDDTNRAKTGTPAAPYNNIKCLPEDHSFGKLKPPSNLAQCLASVEMNPGKEFIRKCISYLNSLRKVMSTRYLPTFYSKFYLDMKYYDTAKSGWLPKSLIYNLCGKKLIRFDPSLIEPLLLLWKIFDGENLIEYKTFIHILNYREGLPDLPVISEFPPNSLDYNTTYKDMTKPDQEEDNRLRAGLPSGRYLDKNYPVTPEGYCRAHNICLFDESDMMSCVTPSVMTQMFVNHRDMYANREPHVVRRVFEASGEKFTDERFNAIWEEAQKYHSQKWVCYETFRRAMEKYPESVEQK